MELITNLTILCFVTLFLLRLSRQPREIPDTISGAEYCFSPTLIFVFGFILMFAAAFREGFEDTGVYKEMYESIGTQYKKAVDGSFIIDDKGFNLFMVILNHISENSQLLIIVSSVIIVSAYITAVRKYSTDIVFSLMLLLCMDYISSLNGVRQVMAGAVLLLAFPWVRDRKTIPYILLVCLLSTFHASIIVMIPLYFIISGRRLNKGIAVFWTFILVCLLFPSVGNLILGALLTDSTYEEYLEIDQKMGIMRMLVASAPCLIAALYCRIRKQFGENENDSVSYKQRTIDVMINMQFVSLGFTALGMRMVYYARISLYFAVITAIVLPALIDGSFDPKTAKQIKFLTMLLYMIYYFYQIYIYKDIGGWGGFRLAF